MKTLEKVEITPVFLDGYMIPFEEMEDGRVYISEKYGVSIHRCLCGCGTQTVMPFKGPNPWNLIKEQDGTISFTPSILNPDGGHYIITKNVANMLSFCSDPIERPYHGPFSCPL